MFNFPNKDEKNRDYIKYNADRILASIEEDKDIAMYLMVSKEYPNRISLTNIPFIDVAIKNEIRRKTYFIEQISEKKQIYPILKMPNYVKKFFEISSFLKIGFPNAPKPPQKPQKPYMPVYNENVTVPDGGYIIVPKISIFSILGLGFFFIQGVERPRRF